MKNTELASLVTQFQRGDKDAFSRFYQITCPAARARAESILGQDQNVEDALQEAYRTAFAHMGELKTPESAGEWLDKIVANVCLRRQRSAPGGMAAPPTPSSRPTGKRGRGGVSRKLYLGTAVAAILLGCVCFGTGLSLLFRYQRAKTQADTAPEPVITALPEVTPEALPEVTPEPTATPTASPTAAPEVTAGAETWPAVSAEPEIRDAGLDESAEENRGLYRKSLRKRSFGRDARVLLRDLDGDGVEELLVLQRHGTSQDAAFAFTIRDGEVKELGSSPCNISGGRSENAVWLLTLGRREYLALMTSGSSGSLWETGLLLETGDLGASHELRNDGDPMMDGIPLDRSVWEQAKTGAEILLDADSQRGMSLEEFLHPNE